MRAVLSGAVANNDAAEKVAAAAQRYVGEKDVVVNNLEVASPVQVNLRVRVAEVQRSITKQLGFNWEAIVNPGSFAFGLATGRTVAVNAATRLIPAVTGLLLGDRGLPLRPQTAVPNLALGGVHASRININNVIDALAEEGLVTVLAQPNLTAISGQTASFLAGGEFPIPVSQNSTGGNNTITVEFKEFGVRSLLFPRYAADRIAIKVRPEVGQLSTQGAIRIGDLEIPALTVRRAETTIHLGSGESFAIAGLIQDNTNTDIRKFPWLGDLPILGPLFRSSQFQRQETELVIIVTPYVVRPVPEGPSLKAPTDGMQPASDFERVMLDRLVKPSSRGRQSRRSRRRPTAWRRRVHLRIKGGRDDRQRTRISPGALPTTRRNGGWPAGSHAGGLRRHDHRSLGCQPRRLSGPGARSGRGQPLFGRARHPPRSRQHGFTGRTQQSRDVPHGDRLRPARIGAHCRARPGNAGATERACGGADRGRSRPGTHSLGAGRGDRGPMPRGTLVLAVERASPSRPAVRASWDTPPPRRTI